MATSIFAVDSTTGLASFTDLDQKFGITNKITYDNRRWGNMNDYFTDSDTGKELIREKDQQLASLVGAKNVAIMSTPPEGTFLHYDNPLHQSLQLGVEPDHQGYKFYLLRANGVILDVPDIEVLFAPRDCTIMAIVHPAWSGVGLLHLGAPQTIQGVHRHFFTYLNALNLFPMDEATVFFTPYICPKHYLINKDRYQTYKQINPNFVNFCHRLDPVQDELYGYDFVGQAKNDLSTHWRISAFIESNVCNYESAQQGNLYSYTLTKQEKETYPPAGFNAAFKLNR